MSSENMGQRIKESHCVEWDIWISFKLFLEIVTKRKSDSWHICISQSIVWNVIESTRDYLKVNNCAEYFNGDTSREHNAPLFSLDIKIEWNWERLRKPTSQEFQAFLNVLLHRFQSSFRKFHSTETALLSAQSISCSSTWTGTVHRGLCLLTIKRLLTS